MFKTLLTLFRGSVAAAEQEVADRSACQAGQLSSPGATRGLVARTISKRAPARKETAPRRAPRAATR